MVKWKRILSNAKNLLIGNPIKLEQDGNVYKATDRRGQEWFIPMESEAFASWAMRFPEKHERYLESLQVGDNIAEVGACTGEYTIQAAQLVGPTGKVFAFEADPLGSECVRKNALIFNLKNIEVFNEAVADTPNQQALLDININLSGGRLLITEDGGVTTTTLDECLMGHNVDVLKITVNGTEPEVLRGATNLLQNCRVVICQSIRYPEIIQYLEDRNFILKDLKKVGDRSLDVKTVHFER